MSRIIAEKQREAPTRAALLALSDEPLKPYDERFLRNVPNQARAWKTIERLVEAAEAVLSDPDTAIDLFTSERVVEKAYELGRVAGMTPAEATISIGIFYRYFEDRIALLDYVWPHRLDTVLTPYPTPPVDDTEGDDESPDSPDAPES